MGGGETPAVPGLDVGDEVADTVVDGEGTEGEERDLFTRGRAGQDQVGAQTRLDAGAHVGVHPVTDHRGRGGVGADGVQTRADHDGVRLAHEVGRAAGGGLDHRCHAPGGRQRALVRGAGDIRVGGDELGALLDEPDRVGERVEGVVAGLAQHHVLRVLVRHDVARVVQGGGQAGLTDDEGGRTGRLLGQEGRRGVGRGPDPVLGDLQARALQARGQVTVGEDRVVGQHQEGQIPLLQRVEELLGPGKGAVLAHEHAVHVAQPRADGRKLGEGSGAGVHG